MQKTVLLLVALFMHATIAPCRAARFDGQLELRVVDSETKAAIPVRLELRDARNRLVRLQPRDAIATAEGVYFTGAVILELRRGGYTLLLDAGPEYQTFFTNPPGSLEIVRGSEDSKEVAMVRRVDMRREGWFAGDLEVRLPAAGLDVVKAARGVDMAPLMAAENKLGKFAQPRDATEIGVPSVVAVETRCGGLLLVAATDLAQRVDARKLGAEDSLTAPLEAARQVGAVTIARRADAWALPVWVASGKLDAVQIIAGDPKTARRGAASTIRPRDRAFFPGPAGEGRFAEAIYHHLLNCGLRLAPAAGTAAGANDLPLGANRVYVHLGEDYSPERWLAGLKAGRASVSNGPLLRPRVEGEPPGAVLPLEPGETQEFDIELDLAFYAAANIEYLEILKNGQVYSSVRLDELGKRKLPLPLVPFDASGWFAVRAVTDDANQYQYATSGAFFVEQNYQPRISRASVEFFRTWLDELAAKFAGDEQVQADVAAARPFWDELLSRANAE